jgi:hypothetical protein
MQMKEQASVQELFSTSAGSLQHFHHRSLLQYQKRNLKNKY